MALSDQIKVPAQVKGAVGGGAADIPNLLKCEALVTPSQSLASGGWRTVAYDTPTSNTLGLTYATGVWTATVAQWHSVYAELYSLTSSGVYLAIFVNGLQVRVKSQLNVNVYVTISVPVYLGVGDTMEIRAFPSATFTPDTSQINFRRLVIVGVGR